MDMDFEIIDPDDANATIGILAHCGNDLVVPQAWIDGTGSKIGTPIATNQIHRMSWDVKQDWTTNTGTIKFEILCQDSNRTNRRPALSHPSLLRRQHDDQPIAL